MDVPQTEISIITIETSRKNSKSSDKSSEPQANWNIQSVGEALRNGFTELRGEMSTIGSKLDNLATTVAKQLD